MYGETFRAATRHNASCSNRSSLQRTGGIWKLSLIPSHSWPPGRIGKRPNRHASFVTGNYISQYFCSHRPCHFKTGNYLSNGSLLPASCHHTQVNPCLINNKHCNTSVFCIIWFCSKTFQPETKWVFQNTSRRDLV